MRVFAKPDAELTEKEFSATVADLAKQLGWRLYHTLRSKGSQPGFPDWVFVRDRIVFAELKTEKGKPTAIQGEWIAALRMAQAEVYLWRPSDLPEIAQILSRRTPRPVEPNALGSTEEDLSGSSAAPKLRRKE